MPMLEVFFNKGKLTLVTKCLFLFEGNERLLQNYPKTPGFLASGGKEFNPGPEMRLDCSELCVIKFY